GVREDPAPARRARPRRDVDLRVHPGLERVHLRLRPDVERREADRDRMARRLPRHEPRHRLGRAHGRRDAGRDPGRDLLRDRASPDRVRADRGGGAGVNAELERLAASCVFASFPGLEPPDWILRGLERGFGGICLFSYNVADPDQLARLNARLREGRDDLLIGIDEEGGDVTRLETGTGSSYPGNAALGFVDDVE